MSFSLPERVTLKGPNFIREVFERGVGVEGFISFGIGNPAPEAIPVEIIEKAFDEVVHSNPMSLLQYGPMQGDARLAELTLDRLVKARKMNPEGQGLIISNGAGQLLGLVPLLYWNLATKYTWMNLLSQVPSILYATWEVRH